LGVYGIHHLWHLPDEQGHIEAKANEAVMRSSSENLPKKNAFRGVALTMRRDFHVKPLANQPDI
jgi:hypothetical protein